MIYKLLNGKKAEKIFAGWQETLIWSCLDDTMGAIYVDCEDNPLSAAALIGDFCFFAGETNEILIKEIALLKEFLILVPQNEMWEALIEKVCDASRLKKVTRFAFKKEKDGFDREYLEKLAKHLPMGYEIQMIDKELYYQCRREAWSRDLVSQFEDYEKYRELGIGVAVLENGEVVSGASSYARYSGGIEIEIDTKMENRRQGLARVCGARLILECLNRGLYPSWDAQNTWSMELAKQLGYQFDYEYVAYETWGGNI